MPDIKYVIFSDMHLGAENSILTNLKGNTVETDNMRASPVMRKMIECLDNIIRKNTGSEKPTLVLNGDLMELALSTTGNSVMAFERFVELIMPAGTEPLFNDKILFLPGNHDHNLWERARTTRFLHYLADVVPGQYVGDEIFTTKMVHPEEVSAPILNTIIQRYPHLKNVNVTIPYPAYAIMREDGKKSVVISHGHYVESMYSLMTDFRSKVFPDRKFPHFFDELEKENCAWVDFFWSTLGRSGSVGKDINLIYSKLQDPNAVKGMLHNIAESYSRDRKNVLTRWTEHRLLEDMLEMTLGKIAATERNEPDVDLSPDATTGLKLLMEKYVLNQLKFELDGVMPDDVSFVFGHTHKPFQKLMNFDGYRKPVKVYNSGGWVVDTMDIQPLHGGSILLVDEHLDIVALQMYKEGKYYVTLEEVEAPGETECPFFDRINSIIDMKSEPWSGFARIVQDEVQLRHKLLKEIVKR